MAAAAGLLKRSDWLHVGFKQTDFSSTATRTLCRSEIHYFNLSLNFISLNLCPLRLLEKHGWQRSSMECRDDLHSIKSTPLCTTLISLTFQPKSSASSVCDLLPEHWVAGSTKRPSLDHFQQIFRVTPPLSPEQKETFVNSSGLITFT